ncbi:MAG: enoyl-CoA hydratase-related protein [Actinomycetota bacterium]|nr:enoyl-CoA hydratase-related protein [Actinomycetota bacterium]
MSTSDVLTDVRFERVGVDGEVGVLTFDRPERRNALSGAMLESSLRIVTDVSADRSVRALVITGAGQGFCSGADLAASGGPRLEDQGGRLGDSMRATLNPLVLAICDAPFPVVAAVNGAAAGAGVGLALAADFLVASESMRLLLTFSRIGMGLDGGTSWFLARQLGLRRATAVSMLIEPITAELALDWGLALRVAPDDGLVDEAVSFAAELAAGPTLAYAAQKRQLREAMEIPLAEALDREASVQDRLVQTHDLTEGVAAFRDGRPARYRGS